MLTTAQQPKGTAVITGSARGIGRGIALRLAEDGFNIAVNDLGHTADSKADLQSLVKEIEQIGRKCRAFEGDVSCDVFVMGMMEDVATEFGGIDVMVANAGIGIFKGLVECTVEEWDRTMNVNAKSVFLCYKYAAEHMIKQGRGGRLIGASSCAGIKGLYGLDAYSASKGAVRALTQAAAAELGQYGITVNAYCPGAITTSMLQELDEARAVQTNSLPGNLLETWSQQTPVRRIGVPQDVAHLVSYFASENATFMTGQTILIDGGCEEKGKLARVGDLCSSKALLVLISQLR